MHLVRNNTAGGRRSSVPTWLARLPVSIGVRHPNAPVRTKGGFHPDAATREPRRARVPIAAGGRRAPAEVANDSP